MDPIIDYRSRTSAEAVASRYMSRVYGWMTFGLLITGVVSYVVASSPVLLQLLLGSPMGLIFGFILPFALVLILSFGVNRMSVGAATFCFLLYSFSNGILFSTIFLRYSVATIGDAFFITAGSFAALATYGSVTRRDLRPMGAFFFMALIGLVLSSVVNLFLRSAAVDFGLSVIGVLLFAGLTAYDSQRIRQFARMGDTESDMAHKFAIMGALQLYLDFINLFLYMLRFMGGRRRD